MEIYIDVYHDDDGIFGNMGSDELDTVDTETTISKYQELLGEQIKSSYPSAVIRFHYGPTMKDVEVHVYKNDGEPDFSEKENIEMDVRDMSDRVYQDGKFWTMK